MTVLTKIPRSIKPSGNALLFGIGSSSDYYKVASADKNFFEFRFENGATSGDSRGMYLRLKLSGAGGGGEALRAFTTIQDVAAGTAHGAHISLNFGTSGTVTGQGIAMRATLHLPSTALASNVTLAAVQAEIYSDASTSDPGGSTLLSYFRAVNGGDTTGGADVDDDVALVEIIGHTIASGNMIQAETDETKFSHKVRIRIAGSDYFLMACDS